MRVHPDLSWHAACLKCADCGCSLDESCTCFVKDGKTYCKTDYARLFITKCVKCGVAFSKNDFVMRAGTAVYHINCFRCSACNRQLVPGDEFAQRERSLLCKLDNESLERSSSASSGDSVGGAAACRDAAAGLESAGAGAGGLKQQQQLDNNFTTLDTRDGGRSAATRPPSCKVARLCGGGGGHQGTTGPHPMQSSHKEGKTTRIRTVLNEKQLHTLRTCYAANPRPDALMKEQLVEMTGLSPRVIRVWFQNKRCKDKKKSILIKQLQQNGGAADKHLMSSMQAVGLSSQALPHDGQPPCGKRLHGGDVAMYSRGGGNEWGLLDGWYHAERPSGYHHSMMGSLYGSDDSSTYAADDDMYVPPGSPSSRFSDASTSPQSND